MKVSDRSCREILHFHNSIMYVGPLLYSNKFVEHHFVCRTGAADDETSELKNLLEIVDEMARTKPAGKESIIYSKKRKVMARKLETLC